MGSARSVPELIRIIRAIRVCIGSAQSAPVRSIRVFHEDPRLPSDPRIRVIRVFPLDSVGSARSAFYLDPRDPRHSRPDADRSHPRHPRPNSDPCHPRIRVPPLIRIIRGIRVLP